MIQRWLQTLLGLALLLAPSVGLACPACAGNVHNPTSILLLLASFVAFPFFLCGVLMVLVRRVVRQERGGSPLVPQPDSN